MQADGDYGEQTGIIASRRVLLRVDGKLLRADGALLRAEGKLLRADGALL